MFTDHLHSAI